MGQSGRFITFEGGEGSGKSTQIALLAGALRGHGLDPVVTREPGGVPGAEEIRALLVKGDVNRWEPLTEALLNYAARVEPMAKSIHPALAAGRWVLCDRFADSTLAYQGYGRGLDRKLLQQLDDVSTGGLVPDLAIILDLDVEIGLRRNVKAGKHDRMELESVEFHRRVREGFHKLVDEKPYAVLVSAAGEALEVHARVRATVQERLCP